MITTCGYILKRPTPYDSYMWARQVILIKQLIQYDFAKTRKPNRPITNFKPSTKKYFLDFHTWMTLNMVSKHFVRKEYQIGVVTKFNQKHSSVRSGKIKTLTRITEILNH